MPVPLKLCAARAVVPCWVCYDLLMLSSVIYTVIKRYTPRQELLYYKSRVEAVHLQAENARQRLNFAAAQGLKMPALSPYYRLTLRT